MLYLEDIINDIEDDITKEEEEASLQLERCRAKREVIDAIISHIKLNEDYEEEPSTYKDAERARAYRALCRRG